MMMGLLAALAIVVCDHAALRAAPRTGATELTRLYAGDVLEVRGQQVGYLKVYDYRRERGGFLKAESAREVELTGEAAPELLAVMRFLRDSPGQEALGISYGAAYLKAMPRQTEAPEVLDAIAQMAERLADQASGSSEHLSEFAPHLDVVARLGVRMRTFERLGRMRVCYDGELYARVLATSAASADQRAHALLGLTRPDCIDPDLGPLPLAALDAERAHLLDEVKDEEASPLNRSRLKARRAGVFAALAFGAERRGEVASASAARALSELLSVQPEELGEDHRLEYSDAVLRVSAIRWLGGSPALQTGALELTAAPAEKGQTCVSLEEKKHPVLKRCTYGRVRMASVQSLAEVPALLVAVQPLPGWRELWVFHKRGANWTVDVISPGLDNPDQGYVDFAGFVPKTRRLLIAREVKERGHIRRSFEELRLEDLVQVRQASRPEYLSDFGRWQTVAWRRDSLALR